MTDLRVNCTKDTKYCKVATQKLGEQLISLKNRRFFRVLRGKIVCESYRVGYIRF